MQTCRRCLACACLCMLVLVHKAASHAVGVWMFLGPCPFSAESPFPYSSKDFGLPFCVLINKLSELSACNYHRHSASPPNQVDAFAPPARDDDFGRKPAMQLSFQMALDSFLARPLIDALEY